MEKKTKQLTPAELNELREKADVLHDYQFNQPTYVFDQLIAPYADPKPTDDLGEKDEKGETAFDMFDESGSSVMHENPPPVQQEAEAIPAAPVLPYDVSHVKRPDGISDDFIRYEQERTGKPILELRAASHAIETWIARITDTVAEFSADLIQHVVHEPLLASWFATSQRTPPYLNYKHLYVPCNPDLPLDQEVIPQEFLDIYKAHGLEGSQLNYVRETCRLPYMRNKTMLDVVTKPSELTDPVPISECYTDGPVRPGYVNKVPITKAFVAACGLRFEVKEIQYIMFTLVCPLVSRLMYHLRKHHRINEVPDNVDEFAVRRRRFGTLQYAVKALDPYNYILFMRLAPSLTAEENKLWAGKSEPDEPQGYFVQSVSSRAWMATFSSTIEKLRIRQQEEQKLLEHKKAILRQENKLEEADEKTPPSKESSNELTNLVEKRRLASQAPNISDIVAKYDEMRALEVKLHQEELKMEEEDRRIAELAERKKDEILQGTTPL